MDSPEPILIVEDSLTQSLRLQQLLKSGGISTIAVKDGREALALLADESRVRAIVSDINMPDLDGFALCKKVKQIESLKSIPFILLVSLKDPLDAVHAMEASADNILLKDYDRNYFVPQLLNALKNVEESRAAVAADVPVFQDGQEYKVKQHLSGLAAMVVSAFAIAVHERSVRLDKPRAS